jgi:hypothetical protein
MAAPDPESEQSAAGLARLRLGRLQQLQASVEQHARQLELAYAELIEGLALISLRLVEIAEQAAEPPPEWPGGLARTVELRLTETRELSVRLRGTAAGADRP